MIMIQFTATAPPRRLNIYIYIYIYIYRPGCKADYNCLKIMNASGPGQSPGRGSGGQRPPEAETFLSQSMPKTQSPGTLVLNHVYLLYSNNN